MADGKITVEVSTQAVQAELERLRHENARLAREAHTWWTACAGATAELERLRDAIARHPPSERQGLTDEQPSPTAGMTIEQRILHVGGRNNAAGYVEFGSTQAVRALVHQVLRDLPKHTPIPASELVTMYAESPTSDAEMIEFARAIERAHGIGIVPATPESAG